MKLPCFVALAVGVIGCSGFGIGTGSGADAGSTSSPVAVDGATPPGPTGIDCAVVNPATNLTLCTGISSCPNVAVDHRSYPDCGFRVSGTTLDLECSCAGYVCPVGVAMTCADVMPLLANQTEDTVCVQVDMGRCTGGPTADAAAPPSTCDPSCRDTCVGDPTCIQACGC